MVESSNSLIRADSKALIRISLPLMLFMFFEALTAFCERIFLSYYSIEAVHSSLNASYLATIFQSPCVAIGTMAQVFVGYYQGSDEYKKIGPCVWQLIWFSFLSFIITFPLSLVASSWYFKETIIQKTGAEYFIILALGNFLFPLSAALSSFYLGRGKTSLVTTLMLASYALHLSLSWVLILGIDGLVPAFGGRGAALAKCLSLGLLCTVFFVSFLSKANRNLFRTDQWGFSPTALWEYIRPGLVRAFGFLSSKVSWVAITYIVIKQGGQYLDALSIGGTVISFLLFIVVGLYKSILTIASNLIGAQENSKIWKLCRSFIFYIIGIAALLSVPLLFFPNSLIYFFDSSLKDVFNQTFRSINLWIWLYLIILTIQTSFCAILVALQDLKFQLYCYLFLWPISFIPVYFGLGVGKWSADKLWAIMIIENVAFMLLFFIRLYKLNLRERVIDDLVQAK